MIGATTMPHDYRIWSALSGVNRIRNGCLSWFALLVCAWLVSPLLASPTRNGLNSYFDMINCWLPVYVSYSAPLVRSLRLITMDLEY